MTFEKFSALPQSLKLANGISTYFRKTQPSGLVSVQVWVKTGSIHEDEFLGGGLSHYLEHMLFKGTEKYSAEEITNRIQAVGGHINAYTMFSRTVYYIDVPAEAAETAFEVLAQMTLSPKLDTLDAAREKDVILREIDMGNDDPDSRLSDATLAEAFRVHPFRVPIIGYKNVFSQMTERELKTYFEKRYTPANIALVVSGDIESEIVFSLAEKYFADAKEKPSPQPFIPAEPPQLAPREVTLRGNVNILRGNMLWKIPGVAHDDTPALSVLATLLGKGDSSVLWQELHDKQELVHAIDVSAWAPGDNGLFWVSYAADHGKREEIESAVLKTVETIARDGVSPALLKKVSRQALVGIVNSLATASSSAARLGAECVERGDPAATQLFLEKINALTSDEIRAVAQKYLTENTKTTSAFEKTLPRKKQDAGKSVASAGAIFPPFEEHRLASGIRVLLQPVSGFPKVHIRASMLAGGSFETERTRGASALLSTLMTLDAGTRSASQIAEKIESLGGRFDEVSGNNTISLFAETLSGDENVACEILADAICEPHFSQENFLRERATQLAALQSDFDEIEEYARITLREKFFKNHPLAIPVAGTQKALEALTLDDIHALRKRLIVPENIVLAVSGEFERNRTLSLLEQHFAATRFKEINTEGENFAEAFSEFFPEGKSQEIEIAPPAPAEQAIVQLAFPDLGFRDERYWVGTLTEELLSGMSGKLFMEIREKRGLAYFVGAARIGSPATGMFYLYAGTEKSKTAIVLEEMRKEIQRLRDGKISAAELDGAKTRICVARRTAKQRAASRCGNAVLNALYGLPVNRDEEMEARLSALTADDIARFATEILASEHALALSIV